MTTAEMYVTGAYLAFLGVVLLYVIIYSFKVAALERAVAEVVERPAATALVADALQDAERVVAAG
jgi:hypothetical protein